MEAVIHKLKAMCLNPHCRNLKPNIRFKNQILEVVDVNKFLRILYDKDMSFIPQWKKTIDALSNKIKTMSALRSANWGPTRLTMKVLHHSYIESVLTNGMPSWYPFFNSIAKAKLLVTLRIVTGLPIHTWNKALAAEADLDSVKELYLKSIVSLHSRINPSDTSQHTLTKKQFLA